VNERIRFLLEHRTGEEMRKLTLFLILSLAAACASVRRPSTPSPLARVNGEAITGEGLKREFSRHHMSLDKIIGDESEVRRYLDKVIERRLLLQEARRMGLQDRSDIREIVEAVRGEKLRQALLKDEVEEKSKPTDEAVRAVYDRYDEDLEIRNVVVETQPEAEAIRARVLAGEDLEKIAREQSIADSAVQGGLAATGWGGDPAREQAMYALKPGELSAVFKSAAGWEIVRMEKRTKITTRPPFGKLSQRIRTTLERRARDVRKPQFMDEVRQKHAARVLDCAVRAADLEKALDTKSPGAKELGDRVCASFTEGTLTFARLAARVDLPEIKKVPAERQAEIGKEIVRELLDEDVLEAEAEARGYARRPEIAAAVVAKEEDIIEDRLLGEFVLKGIEAKDDEVKTYYDAHAGEFVEPARFKVAQIVVPTPELAKEVQTRLASGEAFEGLAKAYSKDTRTAGEGGVVGEFTKQQLGKEFEAVFALKEGEVSAPIKTGNGHHLVKVLSIEPERALSFDEAKRQVQRAIMQPRVDERTKKWVGQLRAAAVIEVSDAAIRAYTREKLASLNKAETEREKRTAERKAKGEADPHGGEPGTRHDGAPTEPEAAHGATAAPPPASTGKEVLR